MEEQRDPAVRDWLPRAAALLLGALVLSTAFIAAYVGALHRPTPRDVPVGVVVGDQRAQAVIAVVRGRAHTIDPVEYDDAGAADDGLAGREVYGVLATDPAGGLRLTTASAASPAATEVMTRVFVEAARQARLPLAVSDEFPVEESDPRGLVPFYLAVGYVLGGYLASTVLALRIGTSPGTLREAVLRLVALAVYAVALGVVGAVLVGPVLGVWEHDIVGIAAVGTLAVFAAAAAAAAATAWLGLLGTGLVILLLVILGNPGSGGIYAPEFLPTTLRGMHLWNPPGLTTDLIKSVVYFDRRAGTWPLVALALWTILGVAGVITATLFHRRRARRAGAPAVSSTDA